MASLSAELVARGHDVSVATLQHDSSVPEFEIDHGVRLHRMRGSMQRMGFLFSESSRRYAPPFPDPELVSALRRVIQQEHPEIVHSHNWLVHSFTPLKARSKAKLVMSLHDYSLVCVQKRLMRYGLSCSGPGTMKCLKCAAQFYGPAKGVPTVLAHSFWSSRLKKAVDMFFPVSQAVVEGTQLNKHTLRYRVIPNFVPDEVEALDDDTDPLLSQLPKGDFLLFVGDITRDKGAEVLLEAYTRLQTQVPLVLIGRSYLPGFAERLPATVHLLGSWPHAAIMGAWKRCTLGLVPSIVADSCPTVAIEAMVMGKPVVAARSGGLKSMVVDGETGFLVPSSDAQALGDAIQLLLDDPELRANMGTRARQRAKAFQAKTVVSQIEQAYQDLLAGASSAGELPHMLVRSR